VKQKYYKVQMKAWMTVEPSEMNLTQIAAVVEQGLGILTAIEVVKEFDSLAGVDDVEVRERFEDLQAAERVLRNIEDLPTPVRERLHAAFATGTGETRKTVAA
jgi:hypothetical protein